MRIEAVRALVSVDDADGVAAAAADDNREVRIAAANGLATLRAGADAVRRLVGDSDPLVRAAALAALGAVGCDDDDVAGVRTRADRTGVAGARGCGPGLGRGGADGGSADAVAGAWPTSTSTCARRRC